MPMFTPPKVATRHYSILNLCVSGWRFPCEFAHFNSSAKRQTPTIALFVYDTFYDTFYNAIRVFSFHSCWLDQKFIIQRTQVMCSVRGMGFQGVINVILRKQIGMSRSFSLFQPPSPPPPNNQKMFTRHLFFKFFLFALMTLIASIITFSKKKKIGKKYVTLDPRHGTLALDMETSTLDPRQKDKLHSGRQDLPSNVRTFSLTSFET